MTTIATAADWWEAVQHNWPSLLAILAHHLDLDHPAYEVPGDDSSPETGRNLLQELEYLVQIRDDPRLARYFAATWSLVSDAYAWSVPGWGVLCDLCSEEWVLYEPADDLPE